MACFPSLNCPVLYLYHSVLEVVNILWWANSLTIHTHTRGHTVKSAVTCVCLVSSRDLCLLRPCQPSIGSDLVTHTLTEETRTGNIYSKSVSQTLSQSASNLEMGSDPCDMRESFEDNHSAATISFGNASFSRQAPCRPPACLQEMDHDSGWVFSGFFPLLRFVLFGEKRVFVDRNDPCKIFVRHL